MLSRDPLSLTVQNNSLSLIFNKAFCYIVNEVYTSVEKASSCPLKSSLPFYLNIDQTKFPASLVVMGGP